MNQASEIRSLMYSLKQDYGSEISLYQILRAEVNPKTGTSIVTRKVTRIKRAIVLPSTLARKFSYDLSFIAANKNFTYGAMYDVLTRVVILDALDIRGLQVKQDDAILFEHKKYRVQSVESLEKNTGYVIRMTETEGAIPAEVFELRAESTLQFSETVTGEL